MGLTAGFWARHRGPQPLWGRRLTKKKATPTTVTGEELDYLDHDLSDLSEVYDIKVQAQELYAEKTQELQSKKKLTPLSWVMRCATSLKKAPNTQLSSGTNNISQWKINTSGIRFRRSRSWSVWCVNIWSVWCVNNNWSLYRGSWDARPLSRRLCTALAQPTSHRRQINNSGIRRI